MQQKKQGQKIAIGGRGVGWGAWAWACGCVGGGGVVWGVVKKLKKSEQSRKKSTPPIKKIVTLPGRDAA